jgi:hypothetical protein
LTVLVGAVVVGIVVVAVVVVVVVLVVVLIGGVEVVTLLVAATRGCVVALGGSDVLVATGSTGVDFDPGADDTARLSVLVSELGDPLDDDVDADDGAMTGSRALDTPELGAFPLVDASGVVGPLVMADGTPGEPGSSARYTRINKMHTTPAIPIPF